MAPLIPQKTGPPPPVRFGVQPPVPKLVPQKTGRAELSRASKFFRCVVMFHVIDADESYSAAEPLRILDVFGRGEVEWEVMIRRCFDACCRSFTYEARTCIYCVIDGIWTLVETIAYALQDVVAFT
jgi:hypothetical protein